MHLMYVARHNTLRTALEQAGAFAKCCMDLAFNICTTYDHRGYDSKVSENAQLDQRIVAM